MNFSALVWSAYGKSSPCLHSFQIFPSVIAMEIRVLFMEIGVLFIEIGVLFMKFLALFTEISTLVMDFMAIFFTIWKSSAIMEIQPFSWKFKIPAVFLGPKNLLLIQQP
jgi:hypothetical protein